MSTEEEVPAWIPDSASAVLVVGACGGAGTTSVALGLAAVLTERSDRAAVAVDATPVGGGDIAARGADERALAPTVQAWLAAVELDGAAAATAGLARATAGTLVLPRSPGALQRRTSYAAIGQIIAADERSVVFDGGGTIASPHLRPLLDDASVALVVALPARVDAANRLQRTLDWIDGELGEAAVRDTTIVVGRQTPEADAAVAQHLRAYLSWVRAVHEIDYDTHLARGEMITNSKLAPATRESYRDIVGSAVSK